MEQGGGGGGGKWAEERTEGEDSSQSRTHIPVLCECLCHAGSDAGAN